ncbi:hypothetical protein [Adlercreutzia sp. ZJ242]|uniref:hypothetical protein n=1 Tax=Adlercreutzia sp. ZJ242 TaxID=2709409 RepID=UPI0013EB0110|nr:hypothetical protein [Adlercreutzia sp. ZJ242]
MAPHGGGRGDVGMGGADAAPAEERFGRERPASPATFSMLYESHDGRLCLFEDEDGHLTSVDASKLA